MIIQFTKKTLAAILTIAILAGAFTVAGSFIRTPVKAEAAAQTKKITKITMFVGEKRLLSVIAIGSFTWKASLKSKGKTLAKVKKVSRTERLITGLKPGKVTVTAKNRYSAVVYKITIKKKVFATVDSPFLDTGITVKNLKVLQISCYSGFQYRVTGSLVNTTGATASLINLYVNFLDKKGQVIQTDYLLHSESGNIVNAASIKFDTMVYTTIKIDKVTPGKNYVSIVSDQILTHNIQLPATPLTVAGVSITNISIVKKTTYNYNSYSYEVKFSATNSATSGVTFKPVFYDKDNKILEPSSYSTSFNLVAGKSEILTRSYTITGDVASLNFTAG